MKSALATVAMLAACSEPPAPPRPPPPVPGPAAAAMFHGIARDAIAAANAKAPDRDAFPEISFAVRNDDVGPRVVELRYQRGMRDFPSDLVDPQAEAARRAIDDCLAEDDALAGAIDRLGMTTMTVRIDHGRRPADVHLVGGHGLAPCVKRRLVLLPADGVFLGVVRVYRP